MRDGINNDIIGIISSNQLTTAILARLDLKSETIYVWTGAHPIVFTGSGDSLLDGNEFQPLVNGVVVEIGDNTYSYNGSDEFTITLAIPSTPNNTLAAAEALPAEYQTRPATIWRALLWPQPDPLAAPIWLARRIRSGAMDKLETQKDGSTHNLILTIESHQSLITNATNQTYLDQRRYDPSDSSQDYAASIANGDPAPAKGVTSSSGNFSQRLNTAMDNQPDY